MACFSVWDIQGCGCGGGVNCVTCGSSGIPTTLSITDANGTYTATWNAGLSMWLTPQLCSAPVTNVADCTAGTSACFKGTNSGRKALYLYSIECTSANHMTLKRYWYELTCIAGYQYAPCSCAVGAGVQVYSSSGSVAVSCGSVAWSGTLTKITGNRNDPVSGTTSFTQ